MHRFKMMKEGKGGKSTDLKLLLLCACLICPVENCCCEPVFEFFPCCVALLLRFRHGRNSNRTLLGCCGARVRAHAIGARRRCCCCVRLASIPFLSRAPCCWWWIRELPSSPSLILFRFECFGNGFSSVLAWWWCCELMVRKLRWWWRWLWRIAVKLVVNVDDDGGGMVV